MRRLGPLPAVVAGLDPYPPGWTYWCHLRAEEAEEVPWTPRLTVSFRKGTHDALEVLIPEVHHGWLDALAGAMGPDLQRLTGMGAEARGTLYGAAFAVARVGMEGCAVLDRTDPPGAGLEAAVRHLTGLGPRPEPSDP